MTCRGRARLFAFSFLTTVTTASYNTTPIVRSSSRKNRVLRQHSRTAARNMWTSFHPIWTAECLKQTNTFVNLKAVLRNLSTAERASWARLKQHCKKGQERIGEMKKERKCTSNDITSTSAAVATMANATVLPLPRHPVGGLLAQPLEGLGRMFYMVEPELTTYKTPEEVPFFFRQAWPYFLAFIVLENLVLWLEHKPLSRLNDSLTSISHGIFQECGRLVFRGAEHWMYIYIYENFRLAELPWDSAITWYLALVGVDFCYYWVHRASHEVHILWAQHQVHHSSEDYNLAVGLRQSLLQGWCGFVFYLPMALIVPPAHFLTHQQFNLLYQFWIHTETVQTLGPLEWVFNTPKHHRVHHGSNLYCLDKNYGGFLIIWDRLFGTFAEERPKEETVYGLVFNQPSFNPFYLQIFYNKNVINKVRAMNGWKNKVSAVVKGPSWLPGRPWTGAEEDKID
ncbi:hypothetical protein FOCC_FOCC016600, partial [Frankliniella occidentalis]